MHDLVEDFIAHARGGAVVGVAGSIANQDVNGAPSLAGFLHQVLQLFFHGNAGADGHGRAAFCLNLFDHGLAGILLSTGDHDLGAGPRQLKGDRSANTATGACDDGHFVVQVEKLHGSPWCVGLIEKK